ncbi:hypothetical protein F5Y01DRAFT_287202 [Xylaria sp. FL0043]|nr:hypothetical protein F5Y01DRAFT_287202 [Xylaria sp. FL0043]
MQSPLQPLTPLAPLDRRAVYGHMCSSVVESIWLMQLPNGDGTYTVARGWALALVTDKDAMMLAPQALDRSSPTGGMPVLFTRLPGDAPSGYARIAHATTASNGRRLVSNTTIADIMIVLGDAGMYYSSLKNGRGLRHWLCTALFLLAQFIVEETAGEYLSQRAINITRHCDTGSSTREDLPIEKGHYDITKMTGEAMAAILLCDREIMELRRQEVRQK